MTGNKNKSVIGIIGGSGVYDILGLTGKRWVRVESPFGEASDELLFGELGGQQMVFLPRHGRGHRIPPSEINFRANIDVLKRAGVTDIISVSAVGSLRENLRPGMFVIVDQFIDRTFARNKSFFGTGLVAHVSMAHPVCHRLGDHLEAAARDAGIEVARGGTYLVMEGPQFSSLAESELYRSWNCDVIGMTNMPEAKLAREAEICYASVAMVTDFDCWHPSHDDVTVDAIVSVLLANADKARTLVAKAAPHLRGDATAAGCACRTALEHALITAPEMRDPEMLKCLDAVAGRMLNPVSSFQSPIVPIMPIMPIKSHIRTVPHYPKQGVMFRDITTLLKDPIGFAATVNELAARYKGMKIDRVVGIEARGFIFGAALAYQLGLGFVPIRKKGKLPAETIGHDYALEYGSDRIEIHKDAVSAGLRLLVVDDLIATGGTADAACKLIRHMGGEVVECCFVIDLPDLGGRKKLEDQGYPVFSLCEFEGD